METTETEPRTERATEGNALVLFALIKSSSKYAYQGCYTGKPVAMRVTWLEEQTEHAFHLENGNRYRREDLTFYVQSGGKLIKLR